MTLPARMRVGLWLGFLLACSVVVARTHYSADLGAFLPSSPTPMQRFLVDELREGLLSRLVMIGIEGREPEKLAAISRSLAQRLAKRKRLVCLCREWHAGQHARRW